MSSFELVFLLLTIIAFHAILIPIFLFSGFKNIFIQKINYLNERLLSVEQDEFESFEISELREFRNLILDERSKSPKMIKHFLGNEQYRQLYSDLAKREQNKDRLIILAVKLYAATISTTGLIYLAAKLI